MANTQVSLQGNTRFVLATKELLKPVAGLFLLAEKSKCKNVTSDSLPRLIYFAADAVSKLKAFFIVTVSHIHKGKITPGRSPIRIQFQRFQKLLFRFINPSGKQ